MNLQSSFLAAAQQLHPALVPEPTSSMATNAEIAVVNKKNLKNLYSELSRAYPAAGKVYWINRCWALLYWQPVYLSLLAVHQCNCLLDTKQLHRLIRGHSIYGFLPLTDSALQTGTPDKELIKQQAIVLKNQLQQDYQQLLSLSRIAKGNAWGLVADCILRVLQQFTFLNFQQKISYGHQWLSAMNLFDHQGRPRSELVMCNESKQLLINSKSCCMHHLRDKNNLCAGCPIQSDETRRKRVKEKASALAEAI